MSVLEKDIEQVVVNWAMKNGFLAPKVKFSEAGWPDRLFISPQGHTIFIEFKRPGFKPDPLQDFRLEQLRKRGIVATWTDNTIEALVILKAALEPPRLPDACDPPPPVPSVGGAVLGSWFRKDLDSPRSIEDFIQQGARETGIDCSSSPPHVQHVAGGDGEMGGVQQLDLFDSPRWSEGSNACE